jgi:spore maturation protein CgeB
MKIVIFGLSITSSWGNGHATTYRALCQALYRRGHRIAFFEHNLEWYQNNRDLAEPSYCDVRLFDNWKDTLPAIRRELADADVAMAGSYFPDGIDALDEILASHVPVKAFYDIDTPITVKGLKLHGKTDYLALRHLPELDVYFSFTGGPMLNDLELNLGAPFAVPLYCSVDPEKHCASPANPHFSCHLSYMGTYAEDRQPKIDELLCTPARRLAEKKFIVAGPQYPATLEWPGNVERMMHLDPRYHAEFYCGSRMTLNVTRREMVIAGWSPSVRLFEAAACATPIVSDNWPGLETFFTAGKEILLAANADDVVRYIKSFNSSELRSIGHAGRERVMASHTSEVRAREFEDAVEAAIGKSRAAKMLLAT